MTNTSLLTPTIDLIQSKGLVTDGHLMISHQKQKKIVFLFADRKPFYYFRDLRGLNPELYQQLTVEIIEAVENN